MTPQEFIDNNPFPPNGVGDEINSRLVKDIQDPAKAKFKQRNLYKLLKNNARLIYLIYHQYNYNQSLASTMSFVYEGLRKATITFDPTVGTKFYQYAIRTIRGLLQNYYNYNENLIHIPVKKKRPGNKNKNAEMGLKYEFCDVNDYSESEYQRISPIEKENEEDFLSAELTMILTEYENQPNLSAEIKEEIEIFKMARKHTLKDISAKTGINTVRLRKMLDNIIGRLKKFYKKLSEELH